MHVVLDRTLTDMKTTVDRAYTSCRGFVDVMDVVRGLHDYFSFRDRFAALLVCCQSVVAARGFVTGRSTLTLLSIQIARAPRDDPS